MESFYLDITRWSYPGTQKQRGQQFSIFGLATRQNKWYTSMASHGVKKARDKMHGDSKGSGILKRGNDIEQVEARYTGDGSENMMEH